LQRIPAAQGHGASGAAGAVPLVDEGGNGLGRGHRCMMFGGGSAVAQADAQNDAATAGLASELVKV
jgi:hypothetical protein